MISLHNVSKRYQTDHGAGPWVLRDVNLAIPSNTNVGLVGRNGAGKSTLLRLIGGVDHPNKGQIRRDCRISWPMGGGGLQGSLTGRQNAKFVCRLYGHSEDLAAKVAFIEQFAELGRYFDEPVKTYSNGMKSRLQFGMSLAFEFDVYISDEATAAGDASFTSKAAKAFQDMVGRAGLIMVAHSPSTLRKFCQAGIWLDAGQAHWFDSIDDALVAYEQSYKK